MIISKVLKNYFILTCSKKKVVFKYKFRKKKNQKFLENKYTMVTLKFNYNVIKIEKLAKKNPKMQD